MNHLKILSKNEKREIEKELEKQFGIKEIPGLIVKRGTERLFLFQGEFTEKQIRDLERITIIERVGIYFAKIQNEEIRLSLEGVELLKNQITKNIFELNAEQTEQWMMGQELNIPTGKKGFLIIKSKNDFLGTGKASAEKINNFIAKNRRLKSKTIIQ